MADSKVWTFFYGSYMNLDVLREVNYTPDQIEVASLPGFDIRIRPRANLVRSDQHLTYGILATGTHSELDRLYRHAKEILGEVYLPEAVIAQKFDGTFRPALCYICPAMADRTPSGDYVDRIVAAARQCRFPLWYIQRLEAFRP